jgi:Ca2+-binding EF-hand superfamily protein
MIRRGMLAGCMVAICLHIVVPCSAQQPASVTVERHDKAQDASQTAAEPLDIIVFAGPKLVRVQFQFLVNGVPSSQAWKKNFERLLRFCDRNNDSRLDQAEAAQLPSAFYLRQVQGSEPFPYTGTPPAWEQLDRDRDGSVVLNEVVDFYRRAGLGNVVVGVGTVLGADQLTDAILKKLDDDQDGKVTADEWKEIATILFQLDRNDDELIEPGELVPDVRYPGATGTTLLRAPVADQPIGIAELPLMVLPGDGSDAAWTEALIARQDRDGDSRLDASELQLAGDIYQQLDVDKNGLIPTDELLRWRALPADETWTVHLGKDNQQPSVERRVGTNQPSALQNHPILLKLPRLRLELRADAGSSAESVAASRKRSESWFAKADINHDGFVDSQEAAKPKPAEIKRLKESLDRDGDNRLSVPELAEWLDSNAQIGTSQVLLTVLDHGAGLFELLDANRDGTLSRRELAQTPERMRSAGCAADANFDRASLPRHLILIGSQGHPLNALVPSGRRGPDWFQAMDRNGDGDVSSREYLGPSREFQKLDRDRDGLLSAAEVQ